MGTLQQYVLSCRQFVIPAWCVKVAWWTIASHCTCPPLPDAYSPAVALQVVSIGDFRIGICHGHQVSSLLHGRVA